MISNISFAFLFRDVVVSNYARAGKEIKPGHRGSVLISLLVTMVILSSLGAAMLPMFSSSTMSSVASNDERKALYMAESGLRYALSELRNSDFSTSSVNALNSTTYSLSDGGTFTVNVFGTGLESPSDQILSGGGPLSLDAPVGKMPEGFSIPDGAFVVNLKAFRDAVVFPGGTPDTFIAEVQNFQRISDTSLTIQLQDDFNIDEDDLVCLAVRPSSAQDISDGDELDIVIQAKDFFPKQNGTIYVLDTAGELMRYFYEERIDDIPGGKVSLTNLSASTAAGYPSGFPFSVNPATGYVILSGGKYGRNYRVIPTGSWGTDAAVSYAISSETATSVSDESPPDPTESSPDFSPQEVVDSLSAPVVTDARVVVVDQDSGEITLGGDVGNAFGAIWFGGDNNIGGIADFCTDGKCQFNYGVRTFFKLYYNGTGDGFTLAFINGADNDKSSVGGDGGAGELMAYAGDSRRWSYGSGEGYGFLDGTGDGLQSPKMALEFDTYTNAGDNPLCSGTAFQSGQRNDPLPSGKDFLQYVFWGSNEGFDCRLNAEGIPSPTYDDNRHGAGDGVDNPFNIKDRSCTYGERLITDGVTVDNTTNWLNGDFEKGPWAVRVEVIRSTEVNAGGKYDYTLKTWIRQCDDLDCDNIDGTYFADTSIEYGAKTPHLEQTVELSEEDHDKFGTFLFGLTEATGGAVQTAIISNLQLSFIRPGDAVISSDPNW